MPHLLSGDSRLVSPNMIGPEIETHPLAQAEGGGEGECFPRHSFGLSSVMHTTFLQLSPSHIVSDGDLQKFQHSRYPARIYTSTAHSLNRLSVLTRPFSTAVTILRPLSLGNQSSTATMSTAARRRLMRDFKVSCVAQNAIILCTILTHCVAYAD